MPRKNISINNYELMKKKILKIKPNIIINFYTDVDGCEKNKLLAIRVNSHFPKILGRISYQLKCMLIHFSTDYVFSFNNSFFIDELKSPKPINSYGKSKRSGEINIIRSKCLHLILRTSWIYSDLRKNFFNTIKYLIDSGSSEIKVVSDQWGAPTLAYDVVNAIKNITFNSQKK